MKKADVFRKILNENFASQLDIAFFLKFQIELETGFDFLGSMSLVSQRTDGRKLNKEQMAWVEGYSDGYTKAREMIPRQ